MHIILFSLTGNHESIYMNQMYGFEGEVKAKYPFCTCLLWFPCKFSQNECLNTECFYPCKLNLGGAWRLNCKTICNLAGVSGWMCPKKDLEQVLREKRETGFQSTWMRGHQVISAVDLRSAGWLSKPLSMTWCLPLCSVLRQGTLFNSASVYADV